MYSDKKSLGGVYIILDKFNLTNNVALVIGGTSGIGKAIAIGLAEAGANVVASSRSDYKVEKTAKVLRDLDSRTLEITTDITKTDEIIKLREKVVENFGAIDILVNSAGMTFKCQPENISEKDWRNIIELNLNSVFKVCQIIGKQMIEQKSGKIINLSSFGSISTLKGSLAYCASKGGINQITKVLACEWAKHGIEVNAIAPGYFITPMTSEILSSEDFIERLKDRVPMKRVGKVEELKGLAVFLSSSATTYMTGEIIYVDGGLTSLGI